MADINQTTQVTLNVNNQQARQALAQLKEQADALAKEMRKAVKEPDQTRYDNLKKELAGVNKEIKTIQSSSKNVAEVMKRLDKASPKELKDTLKTIENNMRNMERGSKAWETSAKQASKLRAELQKINAEMGKAGAQTGFFKQLGSGFASAFKMMLSPATLAFAAVAAVGSAFKNLIEKNKEFEKANSNLAAVLGTTRSEITALTTQAKKLGATTMFTASQVTELQTELAKLGFTQQEILASSDAVLKLSAATGAGLGEAAALAGAALRSFNLDASEMERVTSVLAVSTSKSALSFDKLATAMPIVSPVAKQFGFTIEDTVTLLGKLSDAGFDASSAATATKNIFLNMANSSGKLATALGRPVNSIEDLAPALIELRDKGIDLADMLELTDKRSVAAFATFLTGAEKLIPLKESITDCSKALDGMVNEQMNNLEGSTKILESAWEGLMLSFSKSTGPIKAATDGLAQLLQAWTNWRNKRQGGDEAVAAYEQGVNTSIVDSRIKEWQNGGMSNDAIVKREQGNIEVYQKEQAAIKETYDMLEEYYKMNFTSGAHIDGNRKAELEYMLGQSGVRVDDDTSRREIKKMRDEQAQLLAHANDKVNYSNYIISSLSTEAAVEESAKGLGMEHTDWGVQKTDAGQKKGKENAYAAEDSWKLQQETQAKAAYANGESLHEQYTQRMLEIEVEYNTQKLAKCKEGSDEYNKVLSAKLDAEMKLKKNKADEQKKLDEEAIKSAIQAENEKYDSTSSILAQRYYDGELSAREYKSAMEELELSHLASIRDAYVEGSDEWLKAEKNYQKASLKQQKQHAEEARKLRDKLEQQYFAEKKSPNSESYTESKAALDQLYQELAAKAQTDEEKLELERQYQEARYLLAKEYNDTITMEQIDSTRAMGEAFTAAMKKMGSGMSSVWSQVSQTMSAISDLVSAECDLEVANIEAKYDKEIEAAGENEALVAQLEQKKQDDIAAVKSAASKKQYEMDVISTIAQGAIAATAAWTAGWETGPAGVVLAPLFMALSLATTAIQLATLKKQQEAATATGYAGGGYTTPGPKYQPAGIVHAGEWVATQETLANPTAAAAIATIDQAQRTNSLGSLSRQDVSRSVSGSAYTAQNTSGSQAVAAAQVATNAKTAATLAKLNQRLNEPFVTVNTASGDKGIKKAINLYDRMNRGGK